MKVEALIATMNQTDDSILEKMNIQSDAVVINQSDRFVWQEYERNNHAVRFLTLPERGIGLSRNTALMRARGDICLFSDDDLIYHNNYPQMLQQAFAEYPNADVIVFNINSINNLKTRYRIKTPMRVRWFDYMRYGAARIAVKRESIIRCNISFSLLFGGGARYSCGEDTLFLQDCLKSGLKIYAVPLTLAEIDDSSSTWFNGYNRKFLQDRGALYAAMYRRSAPLQSLVYLLRHKEVWREIGHLHSAWTLMCEGIARYRAEQ